MSKYRSPIEVIYDDISKKIINEYEDQIVCEIRKEYDDRYYIQLRVDHHLLCVFNDIKEKNIRIMNADTDTNTILL